jgi:ribosomal protein S18 acetylase RimI-like enzyme
MNEDLPTLRLISENDDLRLLSIADLDDASEIASRAFYPTPLWQYVFPNDSNRANMLSRLYRVFYAFGIHHGQVYGVSNPLEGVVVWSIPGQHKAVFRGLVKAGFLRLCCGPMLVPILRSIKIFTRFETLQRKYAPEPHYQLRSVAVSPDSQGKGFASKLIKPFLAKADEQSMSVYTETTVPSNVGLYKHYGLECKEQFRIEGTGFSIWAMYRPAK